MLKPGDTIRVGKTALQLHVAVAPKDETSVPLHKPPRTIKADSTALAGRTIGRYVLGGLIATGKTGTVYKARDERDGKTVAVKVFHPNFVEDKDDVQRLHPRNEDDGRAPPPQHCRDPRRGQTRVDVLGRDGVRRRRELARVIQRAGVATCSTGVTP